MSSIDARLADLNITLPDAPMPVANYVPYVVSGNLVYISGQVSLAEDGLMVGKVGADISLELGQNAARACAINLLSQLKAACGGNLDRVKKVVKLGGFVNCTQTSSITPKSSMGLQM